MILQRTPQRVPAAIVEMTTAFAFDDEESFVILVFGIFGRLRRCWRAGRRNTARNVAEH